MKKLMSLFMVLTMLACMLTGCVTTGGNDKAEDKAEDKTNTSASDKKEETKKEEDKKEEAAAPSRTDVNLAVTTTFGASNGHGNRIVSDILWKTQIFEPLYYMDELTLEYQPRIATEYSVSDDGLVYTFKLNEKAKFHNGDPVKASDVVYTYESIKSAPGWAAFAANIDYAEAIDDQTVAIHWLAPSAAAMNHVANIWIISEKVDKESDGTGVYLGGTGPYYMVEYNPETNVVLEAFPDYYRGEAAIKTINYKVVTDANTGAMALEAGELDFYSTNIAGYESFQGMEGFKSEAVAANHITYLLVNYMASDVLANDKVREAIGYAIDKDAINIAAYGGYAFPADYMENPQYNQGAPEGDIVYNYDPEKAKELLAEAGYPDGVNIGKVLTTAANYFPDVAVVVQACLAEVGIQSEVDIMENAACIAAMRAQDYDIGVMGYTNTGDYDSFRQRVHSSQVGGYMIKYEGDKFDYKYFDQLFADQLAELDPAKRLEITKELNDAVMATCTQFPLFHKSMLYVWDEDLNAICVPNFPVIYDWSWN